MTNKETNTEAYKATLTFFLEEEIYEDDTFIEAIEEEAFTLIVYTEYNPATGLHTLEPFMLLDGEYARIEQDDMQEFDLATPSLWDDLMGNLSEYLALADGIPAWSHSYSPED